MQKVYLLLRGNQQNGPYNLDELLQFDLKPVDLIWIEGKSAGWYYPQEIKELLPHLPFIKPEVGRAASQNPAQQSRASVPSKKVFVAMPALAVAQTISNGAGNEPAPVIKQEPAPLPVVPAMEAVIKAAYAKSEENVEADYSPPAYNQGHKKKVAAIRKKMAIVAITLAVGVMVVATINRFSTPPDDAVSQGRLAATPDRDSVATNHNEPLIPPPVGQATNGKQPLSKPKAAAVKTTAVKSVLSPRQPANEAGDEVTHKQEKPAIPTVDETLVINKEEKTVVIAEAPKEKKKKLKEKILDLFKKKDTPVKEEAKGVEVEDGERRSVHRQSDADLAGQVRIKFTIPNDWMMGIKGAKISLTNKSSQTITKATIDVLYYNEDNELLQTKPVSFGKINAKETGTVSIPDHSFADHVEYKIVSVQGAGEPLAGM